MFLLIVGYIATSVVENESIGGENCGGFLVDIGA